MFAHGAWKGRPAAGSTPSDQVPAAGSAKEEPPATWTERVAREKFTGDLDGMVKRRVIRVLVVSDRTNIFFDGIQMRGIMYEMFREFEAGLNKKLKTGNAAVSLFFLPVDRDQVINALADGRGDIVGKPAAITDEWKKYADFSDPIRENISYVVVTGPKSPAVSKLEDLSGKEVYIHKLSAFYLAIQKLNERFKGEGRPPVIRAVLVSMPAFAAASSWVFSVFDNLFNLLTCASVTISKRLRAIFDGR